MKKMILVLVAAVTLSTANATTSNSTAVTETVMLEKKKVSSFCMAIVKGDFQAVKKMISLGEDVNQKSNGLTPAMYAARYNKSEILQLLIDKGANLNAKCPKGHTALKYARLSNATDAIKVIKTAKG